MKKFILLLMGFVCTILNLNCSGSDDPLNFDPAPDSGEVITVKVTEYKTNLPVTRVKVSTFSCKNYDVEFGNCTEQVLFSSCTTNSTGTGNCRFPKINFHKVTLEKPQHWLATYRNENNYRYTIVPESWIEISFQTNVDFPETAHFFITVTGDNSYTQTFIPESGISTETLTLLGNQENDIDWVLYETNNASSAVLNSGSFTIEAGKFENLSYTLNY